MKKSSPTFFKLIFNNVLLIITIAILYFVAAKASFLVATTSEHSVVTPIFYAAEGIALSATILFGSRIGISVFLGEFAFVLSGDLAFYPAFLLGMINALEAVMGGLLFRRWQLKPALGSVNDFTTLIVLIVFVLQPFSATFGNLVLLMNGLLDSSHFVASWLSWWSANVIGQCLITPLLLTILSKPFPFKKQHFKLVIPLGLLFSAAYFIFERNVTNLPIALAFIIPLLLWIAYRGNLTFVCISTIFLTLLAIHGTNLHKGIFSVDKDSHLVELNIFILGLSITAQFISVLLAEIMTKMENQAIFPVSDYKQHLVNKQKILVDLLFFTIFCTGIVISFQLEKSQYIHEHKKAAMFARSYSLVLKGQINSLSADMTRNINIAEIVNFINKDFIELYDYQITQILNDNSSVKIIYRSTPNELSQAANQSIKILDGMWILSVKPKNGYTNPLDLIITLFISFIFALLASQLLKRYLIVLNQKRTYLEHHFALDKAAIFAETDSQGVITFVNEHFCRISGYSKEELIGSTYSLIKSDVHPAEFYEKLWETIISGNVWRDELCNRHKNGNLYWVNSVIVPILDKDDTKPKKYITIRFDITDRKNAEKHQLELTKQVNQMQKVESLSRLTSGIAHDFNNILSAIIGYNQLNGYAGEDCTDEKLKKEILFNTEQVNMASERAVNLIKKMMAYSRQNTTNKEIEVKPTHEVIHEVLVLMHPALTSLFQLNSEVDNTLTIQIDSIELHQILTNLIVNARDAMPQGGVITVSLKQLSIQEHVCNTCVQTLEDEFIELSVSDNGTGIEQDVITRIFDPFFTTKPIGEGTGLGLSTVSGMVHEALGHIIIKSSTTAPNTGTTFKLLFPLG
jgi:PAS domain S-box-containing protein